MRDTIFALSSGQPPAAIAIIRISGPTAFGALRMLAGRIPAARIATVMTLCDPADGDVLDRALVLAFPAPRSATGEDVVELHLHGGRAVVRAIEGVLVLQPGMRGAEPGEFTRRALTNGVVDLAQAEGLGDLMIAETEAQRRVAIGAVEGRIGSLIAAWSRRILDLAAGVEALLDFADADDVSSVAFLQIADGIDVVAAAMEAAHAVPPVERLRDGIRVVLAGPRNAGKSALFNRLVDREAAIVSPIAGTTRDRIEAPIVHAGTAYVLIDTAGLTTDTDDPIERIGIQRTQSAVDTADIILWLGDDGPPTGAIHVRSRCDLPGRTVRAGGDCEVSAVTGAGIDTLWQMIRARAEALLPRLDAIALNQRQRSLVGAAAADLREIGQTADLLLVAEHLRNALSTLGKIVGTIDTEAMLDALFARFCIGK